MKPAVEQIFHAVADLSPEARTQYFRSHNIDQNTRHEVETLLAFDGCSSEALEQDIGNAAARAVVHTEPRVDDEIWYRVAMKLLRPGANADATTIDVYSAGLTIRQKVQLFVKVCAAVSDLHDKRILHRDLKPANILVTSKGEPKLVEADIAKLPDAHQDSAATAIRALTPGYASPEQVTGRPITTASDVYSLGAVLYMLLTGQSPHQAGEGSAAAKISPPSRLAPAVKNDLEIIVMKALRKEPQERYASVEALMEDLHAFLHRRSVQARAGDALRRFIRRIAALLPTGASPT